MAARYRVGIIACGLISEHCHLPAYRKIPGVEVVAAADISPEVRRKWTEELGVRTMYANAEEMLAQEQLDIVSVNTWPPLRPPMVELACARGVKGIVAEKPMAVDLAGCDRMIQAAERAGTVLIVGHQRRFHSRYVQARALIDSGAIGEVVQITGYSPADMLTGGTHSVDIVRYLNHDVPVEWVIGQIDRRPQDLKNAPLFGMGQWEQTRTRYGHHVESGAVALLHFANGVRALLETGIIMREARGGWPATIYGTDGQIDVGPDEPAAGQPWLRAQVKDRTGWISPEVVPNDPFEAEIVALIDVLEHGGTHPLDARSGRADHEINMAIYESARRRARIDLPLLVGESPLEAMVTAGEI